MLSKIQFPLFKFPHSQNGGSSGAFPVVALWSPRVARALSDYAVFIIHIVCLHKWVIDCRASYAVIFRNVLITADLFHDGGLGHFPAQGMDVHGSCNVQLHGKTFFLLTAYIFSVRQENGLRHCPFPGLPVFGVKPLYRTVHGIVVFLRRIVFRRFTQSFIQ